MRIPRPIHLILASACALGVFTASASAATEKPGWQLVANTYPTNLVHGVDEVQEVEATAPTFTLTFEESTTAAISSGATAAEVQSALEALSTVGKGNVVVAEEVGHPGVYTVTFTGLLGDMKVAELTGSGATASVKTWGSASGTIGIDVFNVGAGDSHGTITVTDTLPAGVKAKQAGEVQISRGGQGGRQSDPEIRHNLWDCTGNGPGPAPSVAGASVVTCTNNPVGLASFAGGGGTPTSEIEVRPHNPQPVLGIAVEAESKADEPQHTSCAGKPAFCNRVSIAGGGALEPASTEDPVTISSQPAPGGLVSANAWLSNADGTVDRQAGSHPYTFTTVFNLALAETASREWYRPGGEIRSVEAVVPPGFVGDLSNMPQCRENELLAEHCPPESMVGNLAVEGSFLPLEKRVFNMVAPPGSPAELGFVLEGTPVHISFTVRTGSDYAIVAHVDDIPQAETIQSILTLWGVPEEASHDRWHGVEGGCTLEEMERPRLEEGTTDYCARIQHPILKPFLTLPTSCGEEPGQFIVRELSGWQQPNAKSEINIPPHDANDQLAAFTGCGALAFEPAITTAPDTAKADTPTGLTVEVKPPVGGLEEPGTLGTADIQNTTVTLPEGLVINPGQAAGLQACPPGRPGPAHEHVGDALTTPEDKANGEEDSEAPNCPGASKVGTVTIKSPLIESAAEKQFEGNVYVLQSNPPELKLLIAASADGVNLKLVGVVHLNEQTGQLTTKFDGTPELPFTVFKLSFSGGAQAALDTPTQCATYTANADFTPWSSPFTSDFLTKAQFGITEGPGGGPCPGSPMPFAPTLTAGSTTDQAGGYTNFSLLLQRGDGQQRIEKLQFKEPAGLAGMISSVPLCGEPQAAKGECPESSKIGHAAVASGPGPYPLAIPQPGNPESPIFLTGPYEGAPFGLSIVTHVIAGPFNLGTIVTRAKIEVDPHTAQITITTDPFPQIVAGVPTDLRLINSVIDRPKFLFNPTNCNSQEFSGTAWGTPPPGAGGPGATAPISSHFGVGSCQSLKFTPTVAVTSAAKSSKANGASLNFKISYPAGAVGTQSWFSEAKFVLPKQLPARLTTIQKACLAASFEANPASCPPASLIGHATVHTPVLPVPLSGPVYFVSHGSAKFPDAVLVLQGDGVTVDLVGETFIDGKTGQTSATFVNTPDVPFENIEVSVPSGPFSEFAANLPAKAKGNLCGQKLVMPTLLKAQNGLEIKRNLAIGVTGCKKAKKLTRAQRLAAALKACRKKSKARRAQCARAARRRFGVVARRRK